MAIEKTKQITCNCNISKKEETISVKYIGTSRMNADIGYRKVGYLCKNIMCAYVDEGCPFYDSAPLNP